MLYRAGVVPGAHSADGAVRGECGPRRTAACYHAPTATEAAPVGAYYYVGAGTTSVDDERVVHGVAPSVDRSPHVHDGATVSIFTDELPENAGDSDIRATQGSGAAPGVLRVRSDPGFQSRRTRTEN